jgi:hypothetical protein
VRRTDGFAHCPDIVVNSTYWQESDEVAAFEELVGSHGGLGGEQERPFLAAPPDWPRLDPCPVGSPEVHRQLDAWVAALPALVAGGEAGVGAGAGAAVGADAPGASEVSRAPAPSPAGLPVGSSR